MDINLLAIAAMLAMDIDSKTGKPIPLWGVIALIAIPAIAGVLLVRIASRY